MKETQIKTVKGREGETLDKMMNAKNINVNIKQEEEADSFEQINEIVINKSSKILIVRSTTSNLKEVEDIVMKLNNLIDCSSPNYIS